MLVAQGTPAQAAIFREDVAIGSSCVLLCDSQLHSYAAFRWTNDWYRLFYPVVWWRALRLVVSGFRQGSLQGDPLRNGGVILTGAGGRILYRRDSLWPGDHPELAELRSQMKLVDGDCGDRPDPTD